jgi:crotonobetainyl-CoA:carnitine CoA-transferase CaiB-like acyl-CoA transferase
LVHDADVVVESFRPGVVTRLGIGYEVVSKINPRIIYCSLTGFGQSGPYRTLPGHDINYISIAGALGLIGNKDIPDIPLNLLGDFAGAGLHGAIGILLALIARGKTGEGQYIDIAFTDTVLHLMTYCAQFALAGKPFKRGQGLFSGNYPFYRIYKTKEGGLISIGCLEPAFWRNLCQALNKPEFIPYSYVRSRHVSQGPVGHQWAKVSSELERIFLTRTRDEWFQFLAGKDIPISKVYDNIEEVASDPQIVQREMFLEIEDPVVGRIRHVGIPFKLSLTPGGVTRVAPVSGQDSDEILLNLGYDQKTISKLEAEGIIGRK